LKLPSNLISSNEKFCRVVKISYKLKVEAKLSKCHLNAKLSIPITIGSVALEYNQNVISTSKQYDFEDFGESLNTTIDYI
jgi:hypothetical protein